MNFSSKIADFIYLTTITQTETANGAICVKEGRQKYCLYRLLHLELELTHILKEAQFPILHNVYILFPANNWRLQWN